MANCATATTIYPFQNPAGNARVSVSVPVLNATPPASCTGLIVLTPAEYSQYQALYTTAAAPFDYAGATAIFSFFFAFTVGCWIVAKNIGLILEAVRRW